MAYEFERLADVESVEEFPEEGASVLIEHEGNIKKCPADGIGGGGGKIPVLLVNIDYDTDEYTVELEDGRTADEFAASFEKDGIATVLMIKSEETPGICMNYPCFIYVMYDIRENEDYPQVAGGKSYMYDSEAGVVSLTNMDMREMTLLDHYIWSVD